jgi:16S rRNA (cytosine967-C5)-methyltransferase
VDAFLAANSTWKLEPPPDDAVPDEVLDEGKLRVLPQRHGTDGAFAARLRRVS